MDTQVMMGLGTGGTPANKTGTILGDAIRDLFGMVETRTLFKWWLVTLQRSGIKRSLCLNRLVFGMNSLDFLVSILPPGNTSAHF